MSQHSEICRKSDRLVFVILLCAVLIQGGRMLITTSNVNFIKKVQDRGQKTSAVIIELLPHKYSHKTTVQTHYQIDGQDFSTSFISEETNPEEKYSLGDKVTLHFLVEKPAQAIHLQKAVASMWKFNLGWAMVLVAIGFLCKYVYSSLTEDPPQALT